MTSQIRVLVVDDEPSIRNSLMEYLEDCQFTVHAADSAERALDLIACFPIDVALVDIRLPKLDGDSLILQAHQMRPGLRFLIHTGSMEYHLPDTLKPLGIKPEHIFLKPQLNLAVFRDAINSLMSA